MEDEILLKLAQEYSVVRNSGHSDASSSSSQEFNLPLDVSFDLGYHLLVKAIQELRRKKSCLITVGIGGPSGSGKTSLAKKIASVFGCFVISMEDYQNGLDIGNELDSIDLEELRKNLMDLLKGNSVEVPIFDFQKKARVGQRILDGCSPGVVIVDGVFALHSSLQPLLDFRVAVVGGVHFSLLSKVNNDIGNMCSLENLVDSIFPLFRNYIEPDLNCAQIRINNSFVSSFREPIYKLKCNKPPGSPATFPFHGSETRSEDYIEMFLRSPTATEQANISDWIKVRQCGIKYYLSLGDQRLVHQNYILRPKAEFEVGRTTLGGLLQLDYKVIISYKRRSTSINKGGVSILLESIDELGETFLVLKGTSRKVVEAEAALLGVKGPWITKSYLAMLIESKAVPPLSTPVSHPGRKTHETMASISHCFPSSHMELISRGLSQEPPSDSSALRHAAQHLPANKFYNFDEGFLVSILKIQILLENKGFPVIVGIGGPSGSGKSSMACKLANIVGCEVISLESYYIPERVTAFMNDNIRSLDISLILEQTINDIKTKKRTKVPVFDFESRSRKGFRKLSVMEDCGVVIFEGIHALHPEVGGVHSHLIDRVMKDQRMAGGTASEEEIMNTVFPMFQQNIKPHLADADIKIQNDFDPVLSPESSLFVLKSNRKVSQHAIKKVLDSEKLRSSVQKFTDIYLMPPMKRLSEQLAEREFVRVRMCEGRFALLIREPIREGDYILQPKVDFDINVCTVSGLLKLGYQAVAYISASATIYQDDKILIEVDEFEDAATCYLQIKGLNKEAVAAAASALDLNGSYTTKNYLQIILESNGTSGKCSIGTHGHPAARLHKLLQHIQSQSQETCTVQDVQELQLVIEDMQLRIRKLERWHVINTVLWTLFMSALVGYSLYQRKRQ
ncbi:uncharacterized protein LOC116256082 isoform X3 [Nymphaea colorata]|uniref:uncharacterized protein LOC116256082 isoform X3 n=1 Tax=Nymphaea colorata TaxID=210225 RepID=UPI00129E5D5E|nr:uncharacterized protein LOC116256082 isoform X3 [Nymphaea colorata]